MTNLTVLQEKIEKMLDGEKKRREVALKFIEEFQSILQNVAETTWGNGDSEEFMYTAWVKNKENGKNQRTDYYFRYKLWEGSNTKEYSGFYKTKSGYSVWGTEVVDLKGADFWDFVRCVINWIPILIEIIERRNESRDQLLGLLNKVEK